MGVNYDRADAALGKYEDLMMQYKNLDSEFTRALSQYKAVAEETGGEKGYEKSLEMGAEGARQVSGQAADQARSAARQAGMTKGAAAMLGSQQAAGAYGQNLQAQQAAAAQQLSARDQARLGAAQQNIQGQQTRIGNLGGQVGTRLQEAGMAEQRAQNQYDTGLKTAAGVVSSAAEIGKTVSSFLPMSDERVKHIFGENKANDIVDLMSKIHSYTYEYKPEFKNHEGCDDDVHVGIVAQELEANPITESSVIENEEGLKMIDTSDLTLVNTSVIAKLCEEIADIKRILGDR